MKGLSKYFFQIIILSNIIGTALAYNLTSKFQASIDLDGGLIATGSFRCCQN